MKAKDLKSGDSFKCKGKRKYRTIEDIWIIPELGKSQPTKEHVGCLLIIDTDCHQWIIAPETEVTLLNALF